MGLFPWTRGSLGTALASSGIAALRSRLLLVGEARNPRNLPGELLPRPTPALVCSRYVGKWVAGLRSVGVEIEAVADVPMFAVRDIVGREDEPQFLGLSVQSADEQESLSISIRGLPPGALLSHGAAVEDEWTVDPRDLDALQIFPPPNFKGSLPLQVDVTARDAGDSVLVSRGFDVRVIPVADVPILEVEWLPAREDVPVDLRIDARPRDPAEGLSLSVAGLPAGARLSAGAQQSEGEWIVAPEEAAELQLLLPPHFSGSIQLNVTATAPGGPGLRDRGLRSQSWQILAAHSRTTY